ncbi:MAG: hypothetical protein JJ895_07015 [Balneolaceae bacterium]|nr:hypothetical protein [Balneolaceae bacterium]
MAFNIIELNISNFIQELKRRNVIKVATAYAIAGWLIIQIVTVIEQPLALPDWFDTAIIVLVAIGFPIALIIAWAFELTPDGMKKSDEVAIAESVTNQTGKKLNVVIISALSLLILVLLVERFAFAPKASIEENLPKISTISQQSVAVLPFADMSENKDQDWFSDGLTEEILNSLAQLPELKVTSRTSAFQFKGKDIDISIIADTLGVAHIVEGSVRRIGDRLRITAQLIRAEDGFHLWSETYDSNTENLFEVQTDIAEEIATTLDVFLDDERRERMFASGTRNVQAFQEYLKGMELFRKSHDESAIDGLWEANKYFDKALALDPNFGLASIQKMDAYAHMITDPGTSTLVMSYDEANQGILESLEYASDRLQDPALKHLARLNAVFFSDSWYQLPVIKDEVKKGLGDRTSFPVGGIWSVEIFTLLGEDELVYSDIEEEVMVDPLSLNSWMYRGMVAMKEGDSEGLLNVVERAKKSLGNHSFLNAFAHVLLGVDQEKELVQNFYPNGVQNWGANDIWSIQFNAFLAAYLGNEEVANELLEKYKSKADFIDDMSVITLYALGREEEAREAIRYIDSMPGGPANLAIGIVAFGNRLFFDLEDAPNLSARFKEAGIDVSRLKKVEWDN